MSDGHGWTPNFAEGGGRQLHQIIEAKAFQRRRLPSAIRGAEIGRINLPSDCREVADNDREMTRGGEQFRQNHDRPRELERLRSLNLGGKRTELDVHSAHTTAAGFAMSRAKRKLGNLRVPSAICAKRTISCAAQGSRVAARCASSVPRSIAGSRDTRTLDL